MGLLAPKNGVDRLSLSANSKIKSGLVSAATRTQRRDDFIGRYRITLLLEVRLVKGIKTHYPAPMINNSQKTITP